MKNVFIIGSKGIPAKYGGFETFVDKLISKRNDKNIQYYVSCLADISGEFSYNGAKCFNIKVSDIGSARAVLYDIKALLYCVSYIKKNKLENCIIYILACRIGPFLSLFRNILKKNNITVYLNPDGHEWKRSKWNTMIKRYWKFSEELMIKNSDLIICDSRGIETYITDEYGKYNPNTTFISYGADIYNQAISDNNELNSWYKKFDLTINEYYLIVGRFVPENNYELIIREFMNSRTNKNLVIITNIEKNKFYNELLSRTRFNTDRRIKFVGTVYNEELLKSIRENAYAYVHGHEVGGTNPSLLEALASTNVNLLLDVIFNKEVGEDAAIYFNKKNGSLANIINDVDRLDVQTIYEMGKKAKCRIQKDYSWEKIVKEYETLFLLEK